MRLEAITTSLMIEEVETVVTVATETTTREGLPMTLDMTIDTPVVVVVAMARPPTKATVVEGTIVEVATEVKEEEVGMTTTRATTTEAVEEVVGIQDGVDTMVTHNTSSEEEEDPIATTAVAAMATITILVIVEEEVAEEITATTTITTTTAMPTLITIVRLPPVAIILLIEEED